MAADVIAEEPTIAALVRAIEERFSRLRESGPRIM